MLEIIIIVVGILLDQGTKAIAFSALPSLPGGSYPLIEGVFHFTYLENTGAAFGMFEGMMPVFVIVMIIASGAIGYALIFKRKSLDIWTRVALSLILAGAVGNFIDRVAFGFVRDFLHFALINFAVFNIADACITIGTLLFAIYVLFIADKKSKDAVREYKARAQEAEPCCKNGIYDRDCAACTEESCPWRAKPQGVQPPDGDA